MQLPDSFIATICNTFKEDGEKFLAALPSLIEDASRRWELSDVQPVDNLSYNFAAFALSDSRSVKHPSTSLPVGRSAQDEVVLKISVPNNELLSEIAALRLFDGNGAARLLAVDIARYMFLLERVRPGKMLATLDDDEQATHIAAEVMLKIWKPVPEDYTFIQLTDWFKAFERLRAKFEGGTGPLDKKLFEQAETIVKDFFAEHHQPMLIHGDLHHYNILSSTRGWLAIDPKGVIGPAAYEAGPLLVNPWGNLLNGINPQVKTRKRIDILHERLEFERQRIRDWGIAHAVLSSAWSLEDGGDWLYTMRCAEMFNKIV